MKAKMKAWAFLLLGLALLAVSCEKSMESSGRQILFKAVSQPDSRTRASYSGVMVGSKERIDWLVDDQIRIYSDNATLPNNSSKHWADYKVTSAVTNTENTVRSDAEIVVTSGNGLWWGDDAETTYKFYGVYPATAGVTADNAGASGGTAVSFSGSFPAEQTGSMTTKTVFGKEGTKIYYPSNAPMYMTAYAANQTESSGVNLLFNPAFTAFHIRAGADTDMKVKRVTLSAEKVGSMASANPVAGAFTETWDATSSEWVFASSSTSTSVSIDLGEGIQLTPYVSTTHEDFFDMVLLALPTDLTGLTLTFHVQLGSDPAANATVETRSLKLQVAQPCTVNGHTYANSGDWLIFDACDQAYLSGMLVPRSVWRLNGETVIQMSAGVTEEWEDQTYNLDYDEDSEDPVVIATKLTDGTSPNSYSFSIFSPVGQSWQVEVLDDGKRANGENGTDEVTITQTVSSGSPPSGLGALTGTIGSPSKVEFTLSGGTVGKEYVLSFSILVGETEYSINSEVARTASGATITYAQTE